MGAPGEFAFGETAFGDGAAATLVSVAALRVAVVDLGSAGAATGGGGGGAADRGCVFATVVCLGSCGTDGGATERSFLAAFSAVLLAVLGASAGALIGAAGLGWVDGGAAVTSGLALTAGGGGAGGILAAGTASAGGLGLASGVAGGAAGAGLVGGGVAGTGLESAAVCVDTPSLGPTSAASDTAGIRVPTRGLRSVIGGLAVARAGG